MADAFLSVEGLNLSLQRAYGGHRVVNDASLRLERGGALGIVGESGSGKSLTLRAIMGLLPAAVGVDSGRVLLEGAPLALSGAAARRQRRRRLAMVFQDSLSALDPVYPVGSQISEVGRHVLGQSRRQAQTRAVELLDRVGIRDPERRARAYPHELSGGMRQRAMLAMALATEPQVLLCDEPTTALDVTIQAQVLELLAELRRDLGLSLLFVSHDLAVVGQLCDDLAVMYAGAVVETGPTAAVLAAPRHPYTRALLEATIDLDGADGPLRPIPGRAPEPGAIPSGCAFHPRCSYMSEACTQGPVPLFAVAPNRHSACLHWEQLSP